MLQFFESFANTIVALLKFLISSIAGLLGLIIRLPQMMNWLFSGTSALPSFVASFFLVGISVSILLFIVNRGGK